MKNNNIIIGIVVVGAILGLIFFFNGGQIGDGQENGVSGMTYDCYGENHEEVDCATGNPLAVVGGVPGIYFLGFTVTATNTGEIPLTCSVIPVSPTSFVSAIATDARVVIVGSQTSWDTSASGDVELAPLINLVQPVEFKATIRCRYRDGINTITLPDITKQVDLTITSDVINAGFNVDFNTPDVGTVVCGDGICQVPVENVINCAADCSV